MKFSEKLYFKDKKLNNETEIFIRDLIKYAVKNIVDEDSYQKYVFLRDKDDLTDYDKKFLNFFKKKLNNATISINNLGDYRFALEYVAGKEFALDTVAHENAHVNMAESLGMEISEFPYTLTFIKTKKGIEVFPAANLGIQINKNISIEEKERYRKVITAPLEYGNKLSQFDLKDLDFLENN